MRINPLSAVWGNAIFELTLSGIKVQQQKYLKIFTKLYNNDLIYSKPFFSNRIKPSFWKFTFEPKAGLPEIERYVQSNFGSCLTKRPPIVKTIYQQQRFKEIAVQKNLSKSNCCPIAENQCKRRIELVCDKDLT